jgi:hypothetical protein
MMMQPTHNCDLTCYKKKKKKRKKERANIRNRKDVDVEDHSSSKKEEQTRKFFPFFLLLFFVDLSLYLTLSIRNKLIYYHLLNNAVTRTHLSGI